MNPKIFPLNNKNAFIATIIDSFIIGLRAGNLGPQPARWVFQGLRDLENDPTVSSMLPERGKTVTDADFRAQCLKVITPAKIEEYFQFDDPANI